MLRSTAFIFLLLFVSGFLAVPVSAQSSVEDTWGGAPPPGPYISSRPQLVLSTTPQRNNSRIPFMGNMPSMPMSMPNQFPAPSRWWRGPTGY